MSHCKVEQLFQMIHQLVVDSMKTGVMSIPPPILTRSFQEMGSGLLIYHEAKKLSCVPLPRAYRLITRLIQVSQAVYTPFMLAVHAKGIYAAFFFTFCVTFLMWFLNGVADTLDNPFRKEARTLDPSGVQSELNLMLQELLLQIGQPTPAMSTAWRQKRGSSVEEDIGKLESMAALRRNTP